MTDLLERLTQALADRYTIEREIGSGGMATVYLAEDLKHHRPVAIKVLRPELAAALGPERFLREIELTARLNHPHILPLLDSGEAEGLLFYVMPYVEGESLRERLALERQLPLDEALRIAAEVADALDFAHQHNVLHRDIKPENILLESKHAVVADFGIARAIDAAGGTRLTETGIAVGTPEYMSPEQAGGGKDLDGRSDVYALGCVLHEMLAGQPPFTGPTVESLVRQHLSAEPPTVTALRPSVPEGVVAALTRSLAKAPADRFGSAVAFGEAIAPSGVSTPPGAVRVERRGTRRWPMVGGIVGVAAVVIAVIGAVLLFPRGRGEAYDPNRVLVVPFTDQSGLREAQALGHMAQDYIIQILTDAGFAEVVDPITALAVSQNVAAAGIAGGGGDVLALADDAQAGTVVSGSYYAAGDSVHIQTRISDARNGRLLETVGPVVGSLGAPSELVARLGGEVVAALAPLLDQDLGSWEPTAQPAAYEAYEAYNNGLTAYLRDGYSEAARHFERAVAADPAFSRAALWAAQSHFLLTGPAGGADGWSHHAQAESLIAPLVESREQLSRYERCRLDFVIAVGRWNDGSAFYEAARCMLDAAPGSDDAKREVAIWAYWGLNRPGEAIQLYRELDPDRGLVKLWSNYWCHLSGAYHSLGDYEGDLEAARQALQRFPDSPHYLAHEVRALAALGRLDDVAAIVGTMRSLPSQERLGWWLYRAAYWLRWHGDHAAAHELFDEAIAWYESRVPNNEALRGNLAEVLYQAERWDDALQLYEELAEEYPHDLTYLGALGRLAARRGEREEALRISEGLRSARYPPIQAMFAMLERAKIAALLGDREEAMTLTRALGQVEHAFIRRLDIDFESLRDHPPFQELMRPKG
jgi:tetratricopeptide (TPR) repeat protein